MDLPERGKGGENNRAFGKAQAAARSRLGWVGEDKKEKARGDIRPLHTKTRERYSQTRCKRYDRRNGGPHRVK